MVEIPPLTIDRLPSELIQHILLFTNVNDLVSCAAVSKQFHGLVGSAQPVWRCHCIQEYHFWHPKHDFRQRLHEPQRATNWRNLFIERKKIDRKLQETLSEIIDSRAGRLRKSAFLVQYGYDAKDFLLRQLDEMSSTEDHLARTWWSEKILCQIQRRTALQTWAAVRDGDPHVSLERALACVDLFIVPGAPETPEQVEEHLDRIAERFKAELDKKSEAQATSTCRRTSLSLKRKALLLVSFLRRHDLLGLGTNSNETVYRSLRNNLISFALCQKDHSSLPLVSTVIYCAVARRLGLEAHPVNYPGHIHAIVFPKQDSIVNLNDEPVHYSRSRDLSDDSYYLYLDPFNHDKEEEYAVLNTPLLGRLPVSEVWKLLGPCTNITDILTRTANNLQNAREITDDYHDLIHLDPDHVPGFIPPSVLDAYRHLQRPIEIGGSKISLHCHNMLQILLARVPDHSIMRAILEVQFEQTVDVQTVNEILLPLIPTDSEERVRVESHLRQFRIEDEILPTPKLRREINNISREATQHPVHKVGTYFEHKKYHYKGIVVGWDSHCAQNETWMYRMGVDRLLRQRKQPFYPVVDHCGNNRYVAEENIRPLGRWQYAWAVGKDMERVVPLDGIMKFAGEFMRRWDPETERFVSNVREEYPDD